MSADNLCTLLLVDRPAALEVLKGLVADEFRLLTASDAVSANRLLDGGDVHLILADQQLPDVTGLDFLLRSRAQAPGSVRMLFARDEADLKAASVPLQQGLIYRILRKPCRPSEFKSALRSAAELHQLRAERRQMRAQLDKAGKLRLQFLALVGRELRTPVTYVQGLIRLMQSSPDPGRLAQRLQHLAERTGRLGEMMEQLLRLAEAERLAGLLKRSEVPVAEVLVESAVGVDAFAQARGQVIAADVPATLPPVLGVRSMLADAFSQLLLTALMVSPDGAKIRLAAGASSGGEVLVEVTDAGEIIPESDQPYVFEPYHFSRTPHPRAGGPESRIGLHPGLATVRRYVLLHGGRIELKETSPAGSTFRIRLPIRDADRSAGGSEATAKLEL